MRTTNRGRGSSEVTYSPKPRRLARRGFLVALGDFDLKRNHEPRVTVHDPVKLHINDGARRDPIRLLGEQIGSFAKGSVKFSFGPGGMDLMGHHP